MNRIAATLIFAASMGALAGGCASHRAVTPTTLPSTTRRLATSELTLAQLAAPVVLVPASAPATSATTAPASLEALQLFAQGWSALLAGQRDSAIERLEKSLRLDPYSYQTLLLLGRARQLDQSNVGEGAMADFQKAAQLRPRDLEAQLTLGAMLARRKEYSPAITHLLLAAQTEDYRQDGERAGEVDLTLARVLQEAGYDRAALEVYERLRQRLARPSMALRGNGELYYLASHRSILWRVIGNLEEKRLNLPAALQAYQAALELEPDNFQLHGTVVRTLLALDRPAQAKRQVLEAVNRFHASSQSLELLRDVFRRTEKASAVEAELRRLAAQRPDDMNLPMALADLLRDEGKIDQAQAVLQNSLHRGAYPLEIVKRLMALYQRQEQTADAARLLIEATAANPGELRQLSPLWTQLVRLGNKNNLGISQLQNLQVAPWAQSAKLFWISRLADVWNRDLLARNSLEQSAKINPPFAPTYRVLMGGIFGRQEWDVAQQAQAAKQLIEQARGAGDQALAAELRGLAQLRQGDAAGAIDSFAEAQTLGDKSPDLRLVWASALIELKQPLKAQKMLWSLLEDYPNYEDAYMYLFRYHYQHAQAAEAVRVLRSWLLAQPDSVAARLLQASIAIQGGRGGDGEQILLTLFADYPDNPELLAMMQAYYTQIGKLPDYIAMLEAKRAKQPENREVVDRLVEIYAGEKRMVDARRVIDAIGAAAASDADLLYYVSSLYTRIGEKQAAQKILAQALQVDPLHAAAANDLGYVWADEGKNLDQAERLVRLAVKAEPDNQSFLDSLGWVLYKRGKFADARPWFERAIGPAARPDPVVLDHLGDTLYRLGDAPGAMQQWQKAMERLDRTPPRAELQNLRLLLMGKIKQVQQKKPAQPASTAATQAA